MEQLTPDVAYIIGGIITTMLVGIGKRFNWIADERITKQLWAFAVSIVLCVAYPLLQGQALPATGVLVVNIFQTFVASLAAYSVYNTAQKAVAGPAEEEK